MSFSLDPRLEADTHPLGKLDGMHLRLMDNALVTWLILVPETSESEIYRLPVAHQLRLWAAVDQLGRYLAVHHPCDKLNVAAIGNVVAQLHVHVIARRNDDYAWPGVVWGRPERAAYPPEEVGRLAQALAATLGPGFEIERHWVE